MSRNPVHLLNEPPEKAARTACGHRIEQPSGRWVFRWTHNPVRVAKNAKIVDCPRCKESNLYRGAM